MSILVEILERDMPNGSVPLLAVSAIRDLVTKSNKCLDTFVRLKGDEVLRYTVEANPFSEVCTLCSELIDRFFSKGDEEDLFSASQNRETQGEFLIE